jgi:hypothetical protein
MVVQIFHFTYVGHGAHIEALTDSDTMRDLCGVDGLIEALFSLSISNDSTHSGSCETLAFLAAMCASEPCTRTLTERCGTTNDNHNNNNIHHAGGTLFTMLADCLAANQLERWPCVQVRAWC